MSVTLDSFVISNPSPAATATPLHRGAASSMTLSLSQPPSSCPSSLRFDLGLRLRRPNHTRSRFSIVEPPLTLSSTQGLAFRLLPTSSWSSRNRYSFVSLAASREDTEHTEIEVDGKGGVDFEPKGTEEAWKQNLESFKEQALKMQSVSQEAYDLYSKKAMVVLKETAEQLRIQADQASRDLSVFAKEIADESIEYLNAVAENSPEPLKDVVETFSSSVDDLNNISKVYDFYLGVPYGLLLSVGGFLVFMLTGSISAIRFGVILGGALLALSVSSLRSWKRGESFPLALTGQSVIAGILFLREIWLLSQGPSFFSSLTTLISGAMLAFYLFRISMGSVQSKGSNLNPETQD